ncbi:MAG TPA: hypothetical protein VJB59_00910 [Bdellovibrionota bacterium]|nr:hypothetical protein [Bdellovibrionota bacterium]
MNIRFSGTSVRWRVSEEEARALLDSGILEEVTPLPHGRELRYQARVERRASHAEEPLQLSFASERGSDLVTEIVNDFPGDHSQNLFRLVVSAKALQELLAKPITKQSAISRCFEFENGSQLNLGFEINAVKAVRGG